MNHVIHCSNEQQPLHWILNALVVAMIIFIALHTRMQPYIYTLGIHLLSLAFHYDGSAYHVTILI